MINRRYNRITAAMVAASMIFSGFAMPAFADDEIPSEEVEIEETEEILEEPEEEVSEESEEVIEEIIEVVPEAETEPEEFEGLEEISAEEYADAASFDADEDQMNGALNAIRAACQSWNGEATKPVELGQYEISCASGNFQVQDLVNRFVYACPDCYMAEIYNYAWNSNDIVTRVYIRFNQYTLADRQRFDNKVSDILSGIDPLWSDAEKVVYLHDYIVTHCIYDVTMAKRSTEHELYTAYDCLVNGVSVCEGYAKAFSVLCNEAGLECSCVTSNSNVHAWNIVKVDGEFYYVDCTSDDSADIGQKIVAYPGCCGHRHVLNSFAAIAGSNSHTGTDWKIDGGLVSCYGYETGNSYDSIFWTERYGPASPENTFASFVKSRLVNIGGNKWVYFWRDYYYGRNAVRVYDFSTDSWSDFPVEGLPSEMVNASFAMFGGNLLISEGDYIYLVRIDSDLASGAVIATVANPYADAGDVLGINVDGNVLTYYYITGVQPNNTVEFNAINSAVMSLPFDVIDYGTVNSVNLSLDGTINLNFLISLPEEFVNGSGNSVELKAEGANTSTVYTDLNSMTPDSSGSYKFTISLPASQTGDRVTVKLLSEGQDYTLMSADGVDCTHDGFGYSVQRYITKAKSYYNTDSGLVNLLDRLSEYGYLSQIVFGHKAAGVNVDKTAINAVRTSDLAEFATVIVDSDEDDGLSFYGASMTLRSKISLNLYFEAKDVDISGFTFRIGGGTVTPVRVSSRLYKITVEDLTPSDLGAFMSINVYNGNQAAVSVSFAPLGYCYSAMIQYEKRDATISDSLYDIVRSLYTLYNAVRLYVK
ncbi:MAG: hypothetical protein K6A80_07870 [Saccharofermentans sp.]|nr:hypothetical protein [Saccharofermentans sp.]